ncbi:MAG: hypothetical protein NVS3B8_00200 [Chitinophagaceae bacterium]
MSNNLEALKVLIGKRIISASTEISQLVPMNDFDNTSKEFGLIEIPLNLVFVDYTLFIYNKWTILNSPTKKIDSLKGVALSLIKDNDDTLQLYLDDASIIQVDLSDDGYIGPEAMSLHGPNHLLIVWN